MTLQELEDSISQLPPDQLAQFREWFLTFDAENWDRQFEADAASGRLDDVAAEAIKEHHAGKSSTL